MSFLKKLFGKRDEPELSFGDEALMDAMTEHFEKWIGPVGNVFHELISPIVHVDVHIVAPNEKCPNYVLFTTGMAEKPMAGPSEGAFAEIMIVLPPDWKLDFDPDEEESDSYWPIGMMKMLARLPHQMNTRLKPGISIPNGDPPEAFPGTDFWGIVLGDPYGFPPGLTSCKVDKRTVKVLTMIPLYRDEMEWKIQQPTGDALFEYAKSKGVDLSTLLKIDPKRQNLMRL